MTIRSPRPRRRAITRAAAAGIAAAALTAVSASAAAPASPIPPQAPATAAVSGAAAAPAASQRPPEPVAARAASASHPLRQIVLPQSAIDLAARHRALAGRPARPGSGRRAARYKMPASDVKRLLRTAWSAFGYRGDALERRIARNDKQIRRESTRRPAVLQGFIGDVNDRRPAGGLLQFVAPTFRYWQVGGRGDRFNPLDNILAAVNAQAHGGYRILDGRSGWSPRRRLNPLRGSGAVRIVPG